LVPLKDGSILAIGGKNTDIDGFMPEVISHDGGKTWGKPAKTPFPALGSNQRPVVLRLADGRLFFASDWQERKGRQPAAETHHGCFVALSSDEGKTWQMKTLPETLPHEANSFLNREDWANSYGDFGTLGYVSAAQGPDGLIHVVTSMNHPSQEFELNEAWIMAKSDASVAGNTKESSSPVNVTQPSKDAKPSGSWQGKTEANGRFVLDGNEVWRYPNGRNAYSVTYRDGDKVGTETYWSSDGKKIWEWQHSPDGIAVWTQYWDNGQKKSISHWKDDKAEGSAMKWTYEGKPEGQFEFKDGELVSPASSDSAIKERK
jgi:hypothetical protein